MYCIKSLISWLSVFFLIQVKVTILDKETQFRIHKDAIPSSHSQTNERGFFQFSPKDGERESLGTKLLENEFHPLHL